MPTYRVLEKSFIDNRIVEAGEEVEYETEPGPNLEPVVVRSSKAKADDDDDKAKPKASDKPLA